MYEHYKRLESIFTRTKKIKNFDRVISSVIEEFFIYDFNYDWVEENCPFAFSLAFVE